MDSKVTVVATLAVILYFLWMDVALFYHVHTHMFRPTPQPSQKGSTPLAELFSPFTGLSVKMMMMDQVNNYIHTPLAQLFNKSTRFSEVFYLITPNIISFIGLLFALVAAKFMTSDNPFFHYIATFFFQCRTWFDALDGIVARDRLGLVQHVSLRNTAGYVVDGIADTLGFVAFLVGCLVYLRRHVPKQKYFLPLNVAEVNKNGSLPSLPSPVSSRRVFMVILCFGLQLAISAFFWDHYVYAYHQLLEGPTPSERLMEGQKVVLQSSLTWVMMWFWRVCNAHSLIQMLLFAIFINRLWEFLVWMQYIGFSVLFVLIFFTEIHLNSVQKYLSQMS